MSERAEARPIGKRRRPSSRGAAARRAEPPPQAGRSEATSKTPRGGERAVSKVQPRPAPEPALAYFVSRARLLFLAYAGKVAAVEASLAERGPLGSMPQAARLYWIGTAWKFAGDHDRAQRALTQARLNENVTRFETLGALAQVEYAIGGTEP